MWFVRVVGAGGVMVVVVGGVFDCVAVSSVSIVFCMSWVLARWLSGVFFVVGSVSVEGEVWFSFPSFWGGCVWVVGRLGNSVSSRVCVVGMAMVVRMGCHAVRSMASLSQSCDVWPTSPQWKQIF